MKPLAVTLGMLAGLQIPFAHAEDAYLDDRSSPSALLDSLYNAINRKEYARAYGYFGTPPADSVEAYQEGYADTESVTVTTGNPTSEGAAGSSYYSLPVAIEATATDGSQQVFAGCYTLRLANPQIQGTPYQPLHIEDAMLEQADGDPSDVLPASCGEGDPVETDSGLDEAKALFQAAYGKDCPLAEGEQAEPDTYAISFNYSYDDVNEPKREARLFRFLCDRGAYNEMHAYALESDGSVSLLTFATPELDIRYENDEPEGMVEDIQTIGYTVQGKLVNSDFDPQTLTIGSYAKWRGVGDAFSAGTWLFREGTFTLVKYAVDASYDGETEPVTLLDYFSGP